MTQSPDILEEINTRTQEFMQSLLLKPRQYPKPFRFKDLNGSVTRERLLWIKETTGFSEDRIMCDLNFLIQQPSIQTVADVRSFWPYTYTLQEIASHVLVSWYKGRYEKEEELNKLPNRLDRYEIKPVYAYITPENELEATLSFAWATGLNIDFIEEGLEYIGHQVHPKPDDGPTINITHVAKQCKVDILCYDQEENYVIVELKTQAVGNYAVEQIKRYIDILKENWNTPKVRGIVIGNGEIKEVRQGYKDPSYNIRIVDASPLALRMKIYRIHLERILYENQKHLKAISKAKTHLHQTIADLKTKIHQCKLNEGVHQ